MTRITLPMTQLRGAVISWHHSVAMPRLVPLTALPEHPDLRERASLVAEMAEEHRIGTAVRIRHWGGRTVYWTWRRGIWSADARRVDGRLRLICFIRLDHLPGMPL